MIRRDRSYNFPLPLTLILRASVRATVEGAAEGSTRKQLEREGKDEEEQQLFSKSYHLYAGGNIPHLRSVFPHRSNIVINYYQ